MSIFNRLRNSFDCLYSRGRRFYDYVSSGVWTDMRSTPFVKLVKTLNLSVRAFFNGDIQTKACALTYRTMLAIVPALALVFAIGRGFGLQDVIQQELVSSFESQREVLDKAFEFVDSYLNQSSEGVFVGIGIALLLWTLISILGSVERAFNDIWGVKNGRSIWRKITDYLAIFLILPVLMICSSGIAVFVSASLNNLLPFISPAIEWLLDFASLVFIWLFFAGVYMLIPNTKVKFKNAFVAGIFAGTAFMILQWLFITGQVYVTKYNAIYGSFAFLPLLLIWLQLVWVITLAGAVVCYASQNIFQFNFNNEITSISADYRLKILVAVMVVVVDDYLNRHRTPSSDEISVRYELPARLVATSVNFLVDAGLLYKVVTDEKRDTFGYAPAVDAVEMTVSDVISRVRQYGSAKFIPGFGAVFSSVVEAVNEAEKSMTASVRNKYIKDLAPVMTDISNQNITTS